MYNLILGALAMACFTAGLFFFRFWRTTQDRFFLWFALSFWIQTAGRILQAVAEPVPDENIPAFYTMRLVAFALILFAIIEKNIPRKKGLPVSGKKD